MAERSAHVDSLFGASAFDRSFESRLPTRWLGWRLRLLVLAALLGCLGVFSLMRWVASSPQIDASFQPGPQGPLTLTAAATPALQAMAGHALVAVSGNGQGPVEVDALALQR